MTGGSARLHELGHDVELAVHAGDGRRVIGLLDQWVACLNVMSRTGDLSAAAVRDMISECVERNREWIDMALMTRDRLRQELERTACVRRQCGMIKRLYGSATESVSHIRRRG
ncbi:MAG: hypothetical protein WCN95_06085 [bacterium]